MFQRLRIAALLLLFVLALSSSAAFAQETEPALIPGVAVTGTLDADNIARAFTFEGRQGELVTISLATEQSLSLLLIVSDETGRAVAQGIPQTDGTLTLSEIVLPQDGAYFVTVLSTTGSAVPDNGSFTLAYDLSAAVTPTLPALQAPVEATPEAAQPATTNFAPGQILTSTGITIDLTWSSIANLDLEIRDPIGGSLRFATPSVPSGGQFGVNVNSVCNTATSTAPTERASWPSGAVPTGSYEIIVYYQPLEDCPTTDDASFSVSVTLDGQALPPIEGILSPSGVFLSSFGVGADGSITSGQSGLYTDTAVLPPLPAADLIANAQPITRDVPLSGILTSQSYFQTYFFDARANDLLSIAMNATSGSLDTLVLLLDANGNVIDSNDDTVFGVTNSLIPNRRVAVDGRYYILATRYGKDVGGTEGGYTLSLTGPTGELPQEIIDLGLERGDIEISLQWNTAADLQLLVRDPRGDSVFDDTPTVPSGGRLAAAGNVNCRQLSASPVSYVLWPQGNLVPGLYEVEVWFQNQCNDTRTVSFTLTILVDGVPIFTDTAQPTPDLRYLTSFVVGVDRQVAAGPGGFIGSSDRLDAQTIDFRPLLESARPIASGETIGGSITTDKKYDLYFFDGEAGDVVTISMETTAGRLDPTLFLIDPNDLQIAQNDDAVIGENANSLIREFILPEDGRYIIIATHFGMLYGGTTGAYNLSFSRLN